MTAPKRFKLTAPVALEFAEQAALFRWRAVAARRDPRLDLLFAIPNGTAASSPAEAVRAKRMGRRPGVPDMFLAVPSRGYHGLFVELKRKNGIPSDLSAEQAKWILRLTQVGYQTAVCYGWEDARDTILDYLAREALPAAVSDGTLPWPFLATKTPQNASQAVLEALAP